MFDRTATRARLRRRIELPRRALHEAYDRGEVLTGERIRCLSEEIDVLLNEYRRLIGTRETA